MKFPNDFDNLGVEEQKVHDFAFPSLWISTGLKLKAHYQYRYR
jgi:hypothetical protein